MVPRIWVCSGAHPETHRHENILTGQVSSLNMFSWERRAHENVFGLALDTPEFWVCSRAHPETHHRENILAPSFKFEYVFVGKASTQFENVFGLALNTSDRKKTPLSLSLSLSLRYLQLRKLAELKSFEPSVKREGLQLTATSWETLALDTRSLLLYQRPSASPMTARERTHGRDKHRPGNVWNATRVAALDLDKFSVDGFKMLEKRGR